MNIQVNYSNRIKRMIEQMQALGIDALIGTRMVSVTFTAGAFAPWRGAVIVTRDGYVGLINFMIDQERVKAESWLDEIIAYAPIPGMDMPDMVVYKIKELGLEKGVLGVELGHSPRGNTGYLTSTEYDLFKEGLPEATFVNALDVVDKAGYVKDPEEIVLMRQATAMADSAIEEVRKALCVGMTEAEAVGIGEMELRRLGSEYHWAVTGSTEAASGYRSCYHMCGTTQPTDKILQAGDNMIVDFHPTYRTFMSDLSHNYLLGKPSPEQQKLADAYLRAAETLVTNLKAGNTIGTVWHAVNDSLTKDGYIQYTVPFFGHGLGVLGHEWYPPIGNAEPYTEIVLEENVVEVGFLSITVPGVGGMRLECPIRVTSTGGEMLSATPLAMTVVDI
ncbi:peptidase M24 [Desulfatibacillum aliphaticivorans]|uniref:Peptidase M24 n=1 Tax=Desulfatibacillum aliphaticivorans TaxID=218208 RepID=B8FHC3_DESAL|nr:Xaa-Pro peptidase family protein [Desulfatibacillum aliphaticivorans]ACL02211.1 peptidase M24 [Desulfatibacillum aliphaticivorans]